MVCWREGRISLTDLSRLAARLDDVDYSDGVGDDDGFEAQLQAAFEEIEYRRAACYEAYPFCIGYQGQTLHLMHDPNNVGHKIYKFLLLATRLNMGPNADRRHGDVDGTAIFEQLSAAVARGYLGRGAESLVFGVTSDSTGFEQKINDLCQRINEGSGYRARERSERSSRGRPRDGKLDVVAWKPFADDLPGKLIGFGQCKTGTSYKDTLTQLQPGAFRDKWLSGPIAVDPVRMFFVAEALSTDPGERSDMAIDGGIMFDRCRIAEFSADVEDEVLLNLEFWANAAASAHELPVH